MTAAGRPGTRSRARTWTRWAAPARSPRSARRAAGSSPTPRRATRADGCRPSFPSTAAPTSTSRTRSGWPGCPLCRERDRSEASYLESILAESVNDVGFRQALDGARGLCGAHAAAFLDADRQRAGSLGAAILIRATLLIRVQELEAAAAERGRTRRRRLEDAARPPACPACRTVATADASAVASVGRLADEPPWAEAVAAADLCVPHVLALARATEARGWPAIERRQLDRLAALRDRLDLFAHRSAHDRRHLLTDELRASVDEGVLALRGGVPGTGSSAASDPPDPLAPTIPSDTR